MGKHEVPPSGIGTVSIGLAATRIRVASSYILHSIDRSKSNGTNDQVTVTSIFH